MCPNKLGGGATKRGRPKSKRCDKITKYCRCFPGSPHSRMPQIKYAS